MIEKLEHMLIRLAEAEWSPEEWQEWWDTHQQHLESELSRGLFLKFKPINHQFRWMAVFAGQKRAEEYLSAHGIPFEHSNRYEQNYTEEFNAFSKAQKQKNQTALEALRNTVPKLFGHYPKFAASLGKVYDHSDILNEGSSVEQIEQLEALLGIVLPRDVKAHFSIIETVSLEGIRLDLSSLRFIEIKQKPYLILGEFWKDADGDLLLIKPEYEETATIYYYAHGSNSVRKYVSGIKALFEQKFAYYNNNH